MTLLGVENLQVSLGGRDVLHGVSLTVADGELVGLIGPNGSGKSTLLRAIAGLLPYHGGVTIESEDARLLRQQDRARALAFLPQSRAIHWPLSVGALVALGRLPHRAQGAGDSKQDQAICNEAMQRMDVFSLRDRSALALSGGEQNRVLIARALAQDTPLLIADEPTAALDPAHQIAVMRDFRALAETGRGVLVATHDLHLAARWCHRIVMLHEGHVAALGTPEQVLTPDTLARVYGIAAHIAHDADGMIVLPLTLRQAS